MQFIDENYESSLYFIETDSKLIVNSLNESALHVVSNTGLLIKIEPILKTACKV